MVRIRGSVVIALAVAGISSLTALADENPRHLAVGASIRNVRTLEQNWPHEKSNEFYNIAHGSRLVPYDWFIHLEQSDSTERFLAAEHIRSLGYLPRTPDAKNPDGLPIGFVKDAAYEDGTRAVGLTCAACHTAQINYKGTAFLVDGAPALGDLERFLTRLATSFQDTAKDDAKFERFAKKVLARDAGDDQKRLLRDSVRTIAAERAAYNVRNLPKPEKARFGPGRVDAFGAIFNEVSVSLLGIAENHQPANAPVSYPFLWDTPHHDKVQWNGAAENRVTPLGEAIFKTVDVGALGRNAGEVLGVFGHAQINDHELIVPRRYSSTVNRENLIKIEDSLKELWSPLWPDEFGALDSDLKKAGAAVFDRHCVHCHKSIGNRTLKDRKVEAKLSDVATDPTMARNFARTAKTGKLKGRRIALLRLDRFGTEAPIGAVLKHVVERVILDPGFGRDRANALLAAGIADFNSLNPGYRVAASIEVGNKRSIGQFEMLTVSGRSISVTGGRFRLSDQTRDPAREGLPGDLVDLHDRTNLSAIRTRFENLFRVEESRPDDDGEQSRVTFPNATVKFFYKARPLNGIWATAPYLHNGSVPNLVELLKPVDRRVKQFHVGSMEFDPDKVGFTDDDKYPLFDTTAEGNSNAGHEYGAALSDAERRQLLEYLKSL